MKERQLWVGKRKLTIIRCSEWWIIQESWKQPGKKSIQLSLPRSKTGFENSYQRIGIWFPILGNNEKISLLWKALFLAVHAATRLHNWIMDTKKLYYSAIE
jgi:hypothetical protein